MGLSLCSRTEALGHCKGPILLSEHFLPLTDKALGSLNGRASGSGVGLGGCHRAQLPHGWLALEAVACLISPLGDQKNT